MSWILSGEVREVERKAGTSMRTDYTTGEQKPEPYDYWVAYVLTGRDVIACRVEDGFPLPSEGDQITAECRISPYKRNGEAAISVRLVRPAASRAV